MIARRGAILLEVVLSLALFVMAATLVGASLSSAVAASEQTSRRIRGLGLAEGLLAQIRAGYLPAEDGDEGDLSPQFPQYRYQIAVVDNPEIPTLRQITVTLNWDLPPRVGRPASTDSVSLTGWQFHEPEPEPEDGGEEGAADGGSGGSGGTGGSDGSSGGLPSGGNLPSGGGSSGGGNTGGRP